MEVADVYFVSFDFEVGVPIHRDQYLPVLDVFYASVELGQPVVQHQIAFLGSQENDFGAFLGALSARTQLPYSLA